MSDDEIIMLWTLDGGMEFWNTIYWENLETAVVSHIHITASVINRTYVLLCRGNVYHTNRSPSSHSITFSSPFYPPLNDSTVEVIYTIDDFLSFSPNERWWKLLLAKHWYSKNIHRFSDE